MNILIPNLGSTSFKFQILEMPSEKVLKSGRAERVTDHGQAIADALDDTPIDAVVLKAAHAGPNYRGTFIVDDGVIAAMKQFLPAASVHNTIYLNAIASLQKAMPNTPIIASFEPEFHATRPDHALYYGVPKQWRDEGVIKYGFHGASHEFVAGRMRQILGRDARIVSCHLGGSSSVCAIMDGISVDHTMGFSPQGGLENATRPGDLDIFAVLYMMQRHNWSIDEVLTQLAKGGGLAGLSGVEGGDIRDLEAAAAAGSKDADVALRVFAYGVKKAVGAFTAAMGGIDAITFEGGIGENSHRLRAACLKGLEFLGIKIDPTKNESGSGERAIQADDSKVAIWTIMTNEELVIARRAQKLLNAR